MDVRLGCCHKRITSDRVNEKVIASTVGSRGMVIVPLVLMLLAGLSIAAWLDLRNLSETALRHQAGD